mmetsp:Transcript_68514/g.108814  ORF Transcript_68514/g.108814 Transcript_68514/m.108814 type:complete len:243 (-) Transcript_68514:324-1052(-)
MCFASSDQHQTSNYQGSLRHLRQQKGETPGRSREAGNEAQICFSREPALFWISQYPHGRRPTVASQILGPLQQLPVWRRHSVFHQTLTLFTSAIIQYQTSRAVHRHDVRNQTVLIPRTFPSNLQRMDRTHRARVDVDYLRYLPLPLRTRLFIVIQLQGDRGKAQDIKPRLRDQNPQQKEAPRQTNANSRDPNTEKAEIAVYRGTLRPVRDQQVPLHRDGVLRRRRALRPDRKHGLSERRPIH